MVLAAGSEVCFLNMSQLFTGVLVTLVREETCLIRARWTFSSPTSPVLSPGRPGLWLLFPKPCSTQDTRLMSLHLCFLILKIRMLAQVGPLRGSLFYGSKPDGSLWAQINE